MGLRPFRVFTATMFASASVYSIAPAYAQAELETRLLPSPRVMVKDGEKWGINTRGRFEMDFVSIDNDGGHHKGGIADRRTRIGLEGFYGNWSSVVEFDLTDHEEGEYHNIMLQYDDHQSWRLRMGYFKEYFGMERLDSSSHTMFHERGAVETLAPQRNLGAQYTYYNDTSSATLGIFTDGFVHNARKDKLGITSRLTHSKRFTDRQIVHLGVAGSLRRMEEAGFSSGPDTAQTIKVIDTGRMQDVDEMYQGGLELAYQWEKLLVEGEYIYTHATREQNPDVNFDGWYVAASWMLTGEQRQYSPAKDAVFAGLSPAKPFNLRSGDWGAWELVARYQELDLNSNGVAGGEMSVVTGGLNWHINEKLQISGNVSLVDTDANATYPNEEPVVYSMRLRVRL